MRCGKLAASRRRAGLVQHRRALPRRLGQVNRVNLIMLSVVPHPVDLGGIGEDTVLLVAPHGAVFPARLPQLIDDGHVLVGGVVPTIVVGLGRQPHAACRAVEISGHDVPADPAACQVVQRRHATGEQIRRLVSQVGGDAETDMFGDRRHHRHHHHRVVDRDLDGVDDRRRGAAAVDVVHADDVGQENSIELAAFREPRQILPISDRVVLGRAVARMSPHPVLDMADTVHVERVEANFFCHRPGSWALRVRRRSKIGGSTCTSDIAARRDWPP